MLVNFRNCFIGIPSSVLALFMIVALVILLWLPFGLNTTVAVFEEWSLLGRLQEGKPWLFTPDANPTRPLGGATFNLINTLSLSDLGLGYNLALIGLFIAKSWLVYVILRWLIPQNPFILLMTALLFIVYPADTGLFTFRAMGTHSTIVLGLTAIYWLVRYWQQPDGRFWFPIGVFQVLSLWVNEGMYPAMFVSPILLLWLDRRLTRRFWKVTAFWLTIPMILFSVFILHIIYPGNSDVYIVRRVEEAQETNIINIATMMNRTIALYVRHISEWGTIFSESSRYTSYLPIASVVGLLTCVVSWQHLKQIRKKPLPGNHFALLTAGFAIILIGHSAYLWLSYQGVHWRVYFASSLGAALFISVLVYWLTWRLPVLTIVISGGLLALASLSALNQHAFYADTSLNIQRLFAGIITHAPQVDSDTTIVVIDGAGIYQSQWMSAGFDSVLTPALRYLYDDLTKAVYCNVNHFSRWGEISCDMRSGGIYRVFFGEKSMIPYSRMIVFRTNVRGEVKLVDQIPGAQGYNPYRLISHDAPLPPRTATFFTCWPLESCFPLNSPPQPEIRLDFDRVIHGMNWENADPNRRQMWMLRDRRSTVIINPVTDRPVEIRFRVHRFVRPDVLDSLRLEVNGHFIALEKIDPVNQIFKGVISSRFLQDETELAFSVNRTVGPFGLSLEFDWLEIKPLPLPDQARIEFDSPIEGVGWEQPTANQSRLWTLDRRATMYLPLSPDNDLEIRLKIDLYLQQDILDSLQLTVNGEPIALAISDTTDLIFRGVIPKSALRPESELVFTTNRVVSPASLGINEDTRGLGLLFDWLEIRPMP